MLYFTLFFLLLIAGLISSQSRRTRKVRKEALERLHARIEEHLVLLEWESASRLLTRLRNEGRGDQRTDLLRVRLLRLRKECDKALELARYSINIHQDPRPFHRECGYALLELGHPQAAIDALELGSATPQTVEELTAYATALHEVGQPERALRLIEPHLLLSPTPHLLTLAADCHYLLEEFESALTLYHSAGKLGQETERLLERMGHCYRHLKQMGRGLECFQAIWESDPLNLGAVLNLGGCLEAIGAHADALALYSREATWNLGDPRLIARAGISAIHLERYSIGEVYLRYAISLGLKPPTYLAYLAYACERQLAWQEAEELYQELTTLPEGEAAGYLGLTYLFAIGVSSLNSEDEVLHIATRSVELHSQAISWELLSASLARLGYFVEAHQIQEALTPYDLLPEVSTRRRAAMRLLRQRQPLPAALLPHPLVA